MFALLPCEPYQNVHTFSGICQKSWCIDFGTEFLPVFRYAKKYTFWHTFINISIRIQQEKATKKDNELTHCLFSAHHSYVQLSSELFLICSVPKSLIIFTGICLFLLYVKTGISRCLTCYVACKGLIPRTH